MKALVHENPARSVADRVRELIDEADGPFTLGLAGGSTPAAMYEVLRDYNIDWARVDMWLSDERWVPWDDERSNGRMAIETLVDQVSGRLHRPRWDVDLTPAASAHAYEETLETIFNGRPADLILLGVGADGHTASLYPGSQALDISDRTYVSNVIPESEEDRLTATYPLLWSARHLLVLAVGEGKATAVRDSFAGMTPAGRIAEGEAVVEWHLDQDAASLLS